MVGGTSNGDLETRTERLMTKIGRSKLTKPFVIATTSFISLCALGYSVYSASEHDYGMAIFAGLFSVVNAYSAGVLTCRKF